MMPLLVALLCLQDDPVFEKDVEYGKGGGEPLTLNLARPKADGPPRACVLLIHGGGWAAGRKEVHDAQIRELARRGYVSATIGYRLVPKAVFPAQIEDVKCAVRFLRAHAQTYGLDPGRIGAVGYSAGAHLSMMLGVMGKDDGLEGEGGWADQPSQVQAVVAFFGPTDFVNVDFPDASRRIVERFLGGRREEHPEIYRKASPITYVSAGDAPMLLIQGTKDALVPHDQAFRMAEAMTAAGVPGRVDLLIGAGHGWGAPEAQRTADLTFAFLAERLRTK
ncbi:MAG TPA: alpha/beta hydrolase [Planctomycetota bacterium]|nr:alpha/beta hydrolase [Planctomycetota bacterium]